MQEPYIDFKGTSRASREWIAIYPSKNNDEENRKPRSLTLISSKIKSDSWKEIRTKSSDLTIIKMRTETGWTLICNVYNDCNNDETIEELVRVCRDEEEENTDLIWLEDFNRHHPMWDNPNHSHLFTNTNISKAEKLIDYIQEFGMYMSLEKEIPTLEHFRSKRLSRPDNVFISAILEDSIVRCETQEEKRPSKTDHFPIRTDLLMEKETGREREQWNWKKVDWDQFRNDLEEKLEKVPRRPIKNKEEAQQILNQMYKAINETMKANVPLNKSSKFQRRWWNKEIENTIRKKTEAQ